MNFVRYALDYLNKVKNSFEDITDIGNRTTSKRVKSHWQSLSMANSGGVMMVQIFYFPYILKVLVLLAPNTNQPLGEGRFDNLFNTCNRRR